MMIRGVVRGIVNHLRLTEAAKAEQQRDSLGLTAEDPGIDRAITEAMAWLARAQDYSLSGDGGVARHYSLITGWGCSYPETTGYIVPTMLAYSRMAGDRTFRKRAKRMLDWLVSLQFPDGGFPGGSVNSTPVVPVTFNTGQIVLGLASGVHEFGGYRDAMCRAADWLVETQDPDGCWRKAPTPFAVRGEKTYETHVAWGLLEADRVESDRGYADAALANVHWALRWQRENGWFEKCCLNNPKKPLTHTVGYALRGVIEAYRYTGQESILRAARRTADGLLTAIRPDGFLPGRLSSDWQGTVSWACLTGTVQIALCWLLLYESTGDERYRDAAHAANRFARRTMKVDGPPETRGAIKGSFPASGLYGSYQYVNWACKFFVDSQLLEKEIRGKDRPPC